MRMIKHQSLTSFVPHQNICHRYTRIPNFVLSHFVALVFCCDRATRWGRGPPFCESIRMHILFCCKNTLLCGAIVSVAHACLVCVCVRVREIRQEACPALRHLLRLIRRFVFFSLSLSLSPPLYLSICRCLSLSLCVRRRARPSAVSFGLSVCLGLCLFVFLSLSLPLSLSLRRRARPSPVYFGPSVRLEV